MHYHAVYFIHADFHNLLEVIGNNVCMQENVTVFWRNCWQCIIIVANCFLVNGLETHETLDTSSTHLLKVLLETCNGIMDLNKKKEKKSLNFCQLVCQVTLLSHTSHNWAIAVSGGACHIMPQRSSSKWEADAGNLSSCFI